MTVLEKRLKTKNWNNVLILQDSLVILFCCDDAWADTTNLIRLSLIKFQLRYNHSEVFATMYAEQTNTEIWLDCEILRLYLDEIVGDSHNNVGLLIKKGKYCIAWNVEFFYIDLILIPFWFSVYASDVSWKVGLLFGVLRPMFSAGSISGLAACFGGIYMHGITSFRGSIAAYIWFSHISLSPSTTLWIAFCCIVSLRQCFVCHISLLLRSLPLLGPTISPF